MKFVKTKLDGAFIIELEKSDDERGFFSNMWDKKKFQENDLNVNLTECNIAFTKKKVLSGDSIIRFLLMRVQN